MQEGKRCGMSELKARDKENPNMSNSKPNSTTSESWQGEMTRSQALAVSWTGLEVLAVNDQVVIFNDTGTGKLWLGIANAKVEVVIGNDGKKTFRLLDLSLLPTLEPTLPTLPQALAQKESSVGNEGGL